MFMENSPKNVRIVRKLAEEKGLSLWKIRGEEDLWYLKDKYSPKIVLENSPLFEVHNFLCHYDD